MTVRKLLTIAFVCLAACGYYRQAAAQTSPVRGVMLSNGSLQLLWANNKGQWQLQSISVKDGKKWRTFPHCSGEYTLLYSKEKPGNTPLTLYDKQGKAINFPEPQYKYVTGVWEEALRPVPMNTAGEAIQFYPSAMKGGITGPFIFAAENEKAVITAAWELDKQSPGDIKVHMKLQARQDGYYSLATPTLATIPENMLAWGGIPGYFQSDAIAHDLIKAYAYMQGIPDKPVIVRERTAATLSPFINTKQGFTLAVIPEPGTGRDPWVQNTNTQLDWLLGLSLMNRQAALTPTAYHPVLGEKGSYLRSGDTLSFNFRYTLRYGGWYEVYKHAVNDIYHFHDGLTLKQTKRSLTNRILAMHRYVVDDKTSMWHTENYKGKEIGAQAYLGGVYGSDKDAMKNADYGAMWMLATVTGDSILRQTRLPYARNFKLQQQEDSAGFFYGAAAGQYYLYKSKRFSEEWGPYVEPIAITYYMMLDMGNMLLFNPGDTAVKHALQIAADRLLSWMGKNGQWAVAYDQGTGRQMFTEVEDLRPTFYGLLVAYKILGDPKYLAAAKRGADWYIQNATDKGHFLGVCGDTRFAPDFATGQSAQALLDLYALTKADKYLQAAIRTAELYTTSIYTHPIPNNTAKTVNGTPRQDWEISQAGLSFEHGGIMGSANKRGPILLASHAGMFVRLFTLTGDSLFLDMARAGALGRDAFVDTATGVASYYWDVMNKGAGPYPHHAWWQIGWITDYLLSEMELRSHGEIVFPRGFIAPKVGPHQTYGFAPGNIYGTTANLLLKEGLLQTDNPYLDYYCAINTTQHKLFLLLLNDDDDPQQGTIQVNYAGVMDHQTLQPLRMYNISANGERRQLENSATLHVQLPSYGLNVIEIDYQ
ncbi:glycerophosphoryl diester phosphodiesterase [Chitinophaga agrisoli]|uniref:Glycerophosphoryl diester phosphodiesterase n=1 Tax=Chitinophaga agrisoli TaxID=2607653 RepID=A0A5B2VW12_9BACT|nr:glycerophosphoryl diester phosphodiesterase [Chitinophaga agrisoli]KAA2243305.1 glycerophosphoryl diester phosphodiesterase [Chitinophaga agrisoli]